MTELLSNIGLAFIGLKSAYLDILNSIDSSIFEGGFLKAMQFYSLHIECVV